MEFKEVITKRRAVNYFDTTKSVSMDQVKQIIETAALAPSGFNSQPWNVIVLTDAEEKAKLREQAWSQPKVTEAPVVLIVLADRDAWKKGHPTFEKNFKKMCETGEMVPEKYDWFAGATEGLYGVSAERQQAYACKNTGFFAMALMLAAKDMGLDSHPMDGFDVDGVRTAFNIPDNFWIPLLLAIGHFDQSKTLHPAKWRKIFDEIAVRF